MIKTKTLTEAIDQIPNGVMIGIGGNVLHRAPMAAVRELARLGKKQLRIVKTAGAMDIDLLCFAGAVQSVDAGFISYESEFGLAQWYRKAVQSGEVIGNEHACYTVISALRAAVSGVDFMPVKGLVNSELIEKNSYFDRIFSPFSGEQITVVKALRPDYVLIHAHAADKFGNAQIDHPQFEDILLSKTGAKVIITTEKIMPDSYFSYSKQKADIPHFLVDSVVHCPKGAVPCDCGDIYTIDRGDISEFKALSDKAELDTYLIKKEASDRREKGTGCFYG